MDLTVMMGFVLVLMELEWCLLLCDDSISGMLNHIGQMHKTLYKKAFCNVLLEKS